MWHAQVTSLTMRLYDQGDTEDGYDNKVPWAASAQAEMLGSKLAYLHAAGRVDGQQISQRQWRRLIVKLHKDFGVLFVLAEREDGYMWIDTQTGKHSAVTFPAALPA